MNEELLNLNESTLQEYTAKVLESSARRETELRVLISNMPQKHSFANYIFIEMEKTLSLEEVQKKEADILKSSSTSYILFTNTLLYLERRWNTKIILDILAQSLPQNQYAAILPLVIDEKEEAVENECQVQPFALSLEEDFSGVKRVSSILEELHYVGAVFSIRDAFTAYKVILAYHIHCAMAMQELFNLIKLEQVNFKDVVGAILLGVIENKSYLTYYAELLIKLCKKQKSISVSMVQLFVTLYNSRFSMWDSVQDVIPHLYLGLKKERDSFSSLLHMLNLKNTVFLFELADGNVPLIAPFDVCREGRASFPSKDIRECMQSLLKIPSSATYAVEEPGPAAITPSTADAATAGSFSPKVSYNEIPDMERVFAFFLAKSKSSFTHLNNYMFEYKKVFQSLSPEEHTKFLQLLLSSSNSLVFKELAVARLHALLC
ncbi:hypothetical protein NECID01_0688 [Nematocida sp. AWRm77]|nr:hypothetical protein NECID01_0688 [Nematocida sp. AWRm77]